MPPPGTWTRTAVPGLSSSPRGAGHRCPHDRVLRLGIGSPDPRKAKSTARKDRGLLVHQWRLQPIREGCRRPELVRKPYDSDHSRGEQREGTGTGVPCAGLLISRAKPQCIRKCAKFTRHGNPILHRSELVGKTLVQSPMKPDRLEQVSHGTEIQTPE